MRINRLRKQQVACHDSMQIVMTVCSFIPTKGCKISTVLMC
uniref:Uncharacterized protein n=1 Tax=Arundo donax TaxID=35708 RepID=A0A0A9BCS7_ARUDO